MTRSKLLLTVVGALALGTSSTSELAAQPRLALERLYSLPVITGTAPTEAAWSPDGARIAFLWNEAGYAFRDVWMVDLADRTPVRLTQMESALSAGGREHPGIVDVSWHPDGRRLVFELEGALYLFRPGPSEAPSLLAMGTSGQLSPDGTLIGFLHEGALWVRGLGGEDAPRCLVSDPRAEVTVESFRFSPDGATIVFVERDERAVPIRGIPDYLGSETELVPVRRPYPGEAPPCLRLGITSVGGGEEPRFIELERDPEEPIFSYRFSAEGKLLVDHSDLYVKHRRIEAFDPVSGRTNLYYREDDPENVTAYWQAEWAPDGDGIYFLSDRDDDYHIYYVAEPGAAPLRITRGSFAVASFTVTKDSLVFVANAPRPEERHVFRIPLEGGEPARMSQKRGTHEPVVSPDGRWAAVEFSSDRVPPELYLTSLVGEGGEVRLTHSPLPGFDEYPWVVPEYVTFESHVDGATIHGRLLLPPGLDRRRKYPVIIGSIYANTVRNQWGGRNVHPVWGLDQFLLQEGYIVFNLDVRGSWGHGRAFRRGIRRDYGGIDVEDVESGARYLETLGFTDMDRVGIWGSSYGGLLATMSLLKKPDVYRAGFAGAPATNVFHALTGEMRVMMAPRDEPDAYRAASAFNFAEGLRDPLMILHGMRDRIVLYQDSVALVDRLIRLGKNVDFVTLPDAGHGWDLEELHETRFAYRKLVEHFRRHLGGGPR